MTNVIITVTGFGIAAALSRGSVAAAAKTIAAWGRASSRS
jgi:hypothetical protein